MAGVDQPLGRVTVTLFADGYVSVSLDPKVAGVRHLRKAAETLQRLAETAAEESKPIDCPVCGRQVRTISARPNGDYEIAPCGHSF